MKSGLLLLNKPKEVTSFDCVRAAKRLLKRTDLGHGGTLDRFASGVLPILAGEGLKLVRFFLENHPHLPTYWKSYEGVMFLGRSTETGDPEGATVEEKPVPKNLTIEQIEAGMRFFVETTYLQMPPLYSAKKIDGKRSSDRVRAGEEVELKPVHVTIKSFQCTQLVGNELHFKVECSKGTYIRSLAQDLAERLGTVAYLSALTRTAVGNFSLENCVSMAEFESNPENSILSLEPATAFLPKFELMDLELEQLRVGKTVDVLARLANSGLPASAYCAIAKTEKSAAQPVALLELDAQKHSTFLRAFQF